MGSIEQAATHGLANTRQTERAAAALNELALALREVVARYRL